METEMDLPDLVLPVSHKQEQLEEVQLCQTLSRLRFDETLLNKILYLYCIYAFMALLKVICWAIVFITANLP